MANEDIKKKKGVVLDLISGSSKKNSAAARVSEAAVSQPAPAPAPKKEALDLLTPRPGARPCPGSSAEDGGAGSGDARGQDSQHQGSDQRGQSGGADESQAV